jgi:hypothetical protein
MFVKGGVYDPSKPKEETTSEKIKPISEDGFPKKKEIYTLGKIESFGFGSENQQLKNSNSISIAPIGIFQGVGSGNSEKSETNNVNSKKRTIEELKAEIKLRQFGISSRHRTSTISGVRNDDDIGIKGPVASSSRVRAACEYSIAAFENKVNVCFL